MLTDEARPTTPGDVTALWAEDQVTGLAEGIDHWWVPEYGSLRWLQMSPDDPRRAAAIITAAEQWRRHTTEEARLSRLMDEHPDQWWREVTADANAYAASIARALAARRTAEEIRAERVRQQLRPTHQLQATAGWPSVALPGRPGWSRHLVDGKQVDLPDTAPREAAA